MPGSGVAQIAFQPTAISNGGDPVAKFQPGYRYNYGDNEFVYAKFDNGAGNVASAAGAAMYWKNRVTGVVTSDKTENQQGAAIGDGVAGIAQGVMTDLSYGFFVKSGPWTVRLASGDSNGAVGNKIFAPVADTDLDLRSEADASVSAAEIAVTEIGRQLAAGVANLALVLLNIPD